MVWFYGGCDWRRRRGLMDSMFAPCWKLAWWMRLVDGRNLWGNCGRMSGWSVGEGIGCLYFD